LTNAITTWARPDRRVWSRPCRPPSSIPSRKRRMAQRSRETATIESDRDEADPVGRDALQQEPDEDAEGHQVVPAVAEHLAELRQLGAREPAHAPLRRDDVDEEVDGREVEERREDREAHDVGVGEAGVLGHEEGARPHDRRHDLPAGRGGGLDAARLLPGVAELLHERDRERARRHDVGDGAARDRTHETRGDDGGLGRAAPLAPGDGVRQVDEEAAGAGRLEEGAEEDEGEDDRGRHAEREAEDPLLAEVEVAHDAVEL
jgi:hypothetical protein